MRHRVLCPAFAAKTGANVFLPVPVRKELLLSVKRYDQNFQQNQSLKPWGFGILLA